MHWCLLHFKKLSFCSVYIKVHKQISRKYFKSGMSSLAENTRAKSNVFAAENNLPNFQYVLHPRTTGFTFIVDKLRKGSSISTHTIQCLRTANQPMFQSCFRLVAKVRRHFVGVFNWPPRSMNKTLSVVTVEIFHQQNRRKITRCHDERCRSADAVWRGGITAAFS